MADNRFLSFDCDIKQVVRALSEFDKKLQNKILRSALRNSAKYLQKKVQEIAPVKSGKLKRSIKVRTTKKKKRGQVAFNVQTGGGDNLFVGDQFYGAFINFGI